MQDRPVREIVFHKRVVIRASLNDGDGPFLVPVNAPVIRASDNCIHLGAHQRIRTDNTHLFTVVGAEAQRKNAVNLPIGQSPHGVVRRGKRNSFKAELGIFLAVLRKHQVIGQRACELVGFRIQRAERQEVVPITDPDGSVMIGEPVLFFRGEETVNRAGPVEPFRQLLVEIPVIFKEPVHRHIQILFQIGTVWIDPEVGLGKPDLPDRDHISGDAVGVQRDQRVKLTARQHIKEHRRLFGRLDDFRRHTVAFRPFDKKPLLDAVFVHTDPLPVQGGEIIRPDVLVARRDKYMIAFRAHCFGRIQDLFSPLRRIGYVAEKIQVAGDQLLKQLRPAALHIFIRPAGVNRNPLLVYITVPGFSPELIRAVES